MWNKVPCSDPVYWKILQNFVASQYCAPFHGFFEKNFFHRFRHYKVPTWSVKESACCWVGRDLYFHDDHFLWGNDWIEYLTILKLFMNFEPRENGSQKRFTWELTILSLSLWNIHQNWFSVYLLNIWKD